MRPPPIAEWIVRTVAPRGDREVMLGDLRRRFDELAREGGSSPRLWYWRQAMSAVLWRVRPARTKDTFVQARFSLLDLKLAVRMLFKYPALTAVGGLAIAFAIWVGAVTFEVVGQMVRPQVPIEGGDRLVAVLQRDLSENVLRAPRSSEYDALRTELRSIPSLEAFRDVSRNLSVNGAGAPLIVAQITPGGFQLPGQAPLLGRGLIDSDAEPGATPVIVLGHDLWQSRFGGDRTAVGDIVSLGGVQTTVVGVMPEGFAFPESHGAWVPLERSTGGLPPLSGARLVPFGLLAPGEPLERAQAELGGVWSRHAGLFPEELGGLRPEITPYALALAPLPDLGPIGLLAANTFAAMLFVLICGSVALLVWARATTRRRELAVRSALGAGPTRIAMQLFLEALVLTSFATLIGLVAADYGVGWYAAMVEADSGAQPFWVRDGVGVATMVYLMLLTVAGAAVVGFVPALKVTRRNVDSRLRAAARAGGVRLRGVWGLVIVAQVAVTVAFPATSFLFRQYVTDIQAFDLGLSGQSYVGAVVDVGDDPDQSSAMGLSPEDVEARLLEFRAELSDRLRQEPEVVGVTFAASLPGMPNAPDRISVEESGQALVVPRRVSAKGVATGFFDEIGSPLVQGRGFVASDLEPEARVAVVDEAFVEHVLDGRSAVGRRVRFEDPRAGAGPWVEIVGVVGELAMLGGDNLLVEPAPGLYYPVTNASNLAIHLEGTTVEAFVPRLYQVAASVDPAIRLLDVRDLDQIGESLWRESEFIYQVLAGISLVAVMLSLMGIYSVLSLTVSQRTREIGVRVALGSSHARIVTKTFGGPLAVVGVGIALGGLLVVAFTIPMRGGVGLGQLIGSVGAYALVMFGICGLACVFPTRRALSIEPTEAFRIEL